MNLLSSKATLRAYFLPGSVLDLSPSGNKWSQYCKGKRQKKRERERERERAII
jgi:hypothetical protein